MEQRVSLITLGVQDLALSKAFYEALGWRAVESPEGIVAFDLIGQTLGLYPLADLLVDAGLDAEPDATRFSGITLSHNLTNKEDVAPLMARAAAAGARIIKPAQASDWGGYHGFFADPDGYIWEIAHNPFSTLGPDGAFQWQGVS